MFTQQIQALLKAFDRLPPSLQLQLEPLKEGFAVLGNCAQSLVHRGDITYEGDMTLSLGGNTTLNVGGTEYTMDELNAILSGNGGGGTWAHFTLASAKTRSQNTGSATLVRYSGESPGSGFTVYDPSQNAPIWAGASGAYGKASKSTVDSRWYIDWLVCTPAGTGGGSFPYEVLVGQFAQGAY